MPLHTVHNSTCKSCLTQFTWRHSSDWLLLLHLYVAQHQYVAKRKNSQHRTIIIPEHQHQQPQHRTPTQPQPECTPSLELTHSWAAATLFSTPLGRRSDLCCVRVDRNRIYESTRDPRLVLLDTRYVSERGWIEWVMVLFRWYKVEEVNPAGKKWTKRVCRSDWFFFVLFAFRFGSEEFTQQGCGKFRYRQIHKPATKLWGRFWGFRDSDSDSAFQNFLTSTPTP